MLSIAHNHQALDKRYDGSSDSLSRRARTKRLESLAEGKLRRERGEAIISMKSENAFASQGAITPSRCQ
jgi:hypothetical protein